MIKKDGVKVINNALAIFDKVTTQLQTGIQLCEERVQQTEDRIKVAEGEKSILTSNIVRAKNVVSNIVKIVG